MVTFGNTMAASTRITFIARYENATADSSATCEISKMEVKRIEDVFETEIVLSAKPSRVSTIVCYGNMESAMRSSSTRNPKGATTTILDSYVLSALIDRVESRQQERSIRVLLITVW